MPFPNPFRPSPRHRFRLRSRAIPAVPAGLVLLTAALVTGCVSLRTLPAARSSLQEGSLLSVAGETVHVVDRGEGEAVVLLHGFGASSWSWRGVTPRLSGEAGGGGGYRTVAIDLFGFGLTERTQRLDAYTQEGQIAMVLGVMDELGIERAHLVGHSYGGALAQTLAVRHPERLRSLVLVDAAKPAYPEDRRSKLAALRPLTSLLVRTLGLRPSSVRRGLEGSVADDFLITDELVRGYQQRLAVRGAGRAYQGLTRPRSEAASPVDISDTTVPTLVVWGEEDTLISVDDARQRSRDIPGARFVALPGIGHLPMEEAPERLAEEIRSFLAEVD